MGVMLKPIIGDGKVNGELFTDLRRHWLLQKPNGQATIRNCLVIKLRYMGDVETFSPCPHLCPGQCWD